jgi:hypothetical protein
MNENNELLQKAFMEVTQKKLEDQQQKINDFNERIKLISANKELLEKMKISIEQLSMETKNNALPEEKIKKLSSQLNTTNNMLEGLFQNKIQHHHHVSKIIWITIILFLLLCLASSGWFITNQRLTNYIANDTKYRYLRLDTADKILQNYLDHADSLYDNNPKMRQNVIEAEKKNQINFQLLERVQRLRKEASELEKKERK